VWWHRWVGLTLTLFLVCVGLTGALLAFYEPLDAWLFPALYRLEEPTGGAPPLSPVELRARLAEQLPPGSKVLHVPLRLDVDRPVRFSVDSARGDDEYAVHPVTGAVLASRRWGDLGQGAAKNGMPFVYRLHFSLALGEWGEWVLGVVALLWTVDCFVGASLTFPPPRPASPRWSWWRRWWPSWRVRRGKVFTFLFTSHRAAGLWAWAALFVFAWSGVSFNLGEVYSPVMRAVLGLEERADRRLASRSDGARVLEWAEALERGRQLMEAEVVARGITVLEPTQLVLLPEKSAFAYRVRSDRDVAERNGATTVLFDATTGVLLAFQAPTGQVAGNTVTTWLTQLHLGAVRGGGTPLRAAVALTGGATVLLAVSGVWLWWRRRVPRRAPAATGPVGDRQVARDSARAEG
jgi:uncharacterized iron-regulated membrane protein